jgi:hypothetical protein
LTTDGAGTIRLSKSEMTAIGTAPGKTVKAQLNDDGDALIIRAV